ncbi:MAG: SCO family protein, partial [Flavobacteriaceae bacterium]|nr:SCO family protein [Flavobacteriaceae bacterium]
SKELPILSYKIDSTGNKSYYTIKYMGFEDQFGQDFNSSHLEDKIYLANFFFTRCPSICPPMRQALINLSDELDGFVIVSHTIDPDYDSSEILLAYAETTGAASDRWIFLRSSEANTKALATQYMTNFRPYEDGTDFYHSSYASLVDGSGQIRGFYNLLVKEDTNRLKDDIRLLIRISSQ